MSEQIGKRPGKRSKPTYIYSIFSMTFVLLMLGIMGVLGVMSSTLSNYFKENIELQAILSEEASEVDVAQLNRKLELKPYIKTLEYVSKEDAAIIMEEDFGDDLDLIGYNPLYNSFNFTVHANYADVDSLAIIKAELENLPEVNELIYFAPLVTSINSNVKKANLALGVLTLLFLIIAISLIDNTLKLAMYSSRFIIKSMQLVGATRWFIIKPFIARGLFNGLISGIMAIIIILGLLYYIQSLDLIKDLIKPEHLINFGLIFGGVLTVGVVISLLSTYFAVRKYLQLKLDDLY